MPETDPQKNSVAKARRRRRKGVATLCALSAAVIAVPVVGVQAHGGDTCDAGLISVNIGDCEGGGGGGGGATFVAPAPSQQQQQQQGGGGGGGGGGSSSSSSSSSSSGSSGSSS